MFKRFIKNNIYDALKDTPVVYVMGPRQSGKTTIVKDIIDENWQYISFDDSAQLNIAKTDPVGFIRNIPPENSIVLDEVQRLPEIFVSIKQAVDENRKAGRFLLTGSANALLLPTLSDSLAGRMEMIPLSTLSESEILEKQPTFLTTLLQNEAPSTKEIRVRDYLIKRIVTGCFPEPVQRENENRIQVWYDNYLLSLIQKDIRDLGHIEHHSEMTKLLKVLTLYTGKLINFTELGGKLELYRATVKKYTSLLEQLFLIEYLPAWHTNSYKRLIKTPKLHVVDTGIVCSARGINSDKIKTNPDILGSLLETFVFNELKKQSNFINEKLNFYHYRDKDGYEIDIVIENSFDEVIGIEIKAAASINPKDLHGLNKLKEITGKKFKVGILLYDGDHTTSFGDKLFAVPIASLWS
ncbi:TPA: ATP-binding protein [Legionella pneumophila]|nr:ATP-binding protein [Legionella pneumophila subsp. fraseri]HAT1773012.1 ATP-binding protein [Legionella pneumophila]MDX1847175.1 ATP-binding protein [Legionella pneumophila subsp. fraseri]HAT2127899.1 ATP-binding protein [Legionella pneumophila]HAT2136915.1 ATP-binding protein [Legionella pneumophila]